MRPVDRALLLALTVDGFIVGLLSVVFLNIYIGAVPFPISAVVCGAANGVLVWLAARHTASTARMLPLIGWLIAMGVGLQGGPGGDALLYADWRTLLLVILSVGVPVGLAWSGRLPSPSAEVATATRGGNDRGVR